MQWQYESLYIGSSFGNEEIQQISALGAQGWRMVAAYAGGYIFFEKQPQPNDVFSVVQDVNSVGTILTPIIAAGGSGIIKGADVILSGEAPARAVTTISLVTADQSKTYWSAVVNLTSITQDQSIAVQPLMGTMLLHGIDISAGLSAKVVAATAAPNWTISFNLNVGYGLDN